MIIKRKYFLLFLLPPVLTVIACSREQVTTQVSQPTHIHSTADELEAFTDLSRLPRYIEGSMTAQVSSYDTTGGNDDGFSGKYSKLRKDDKGNLVLFDITGKGVLTRIWTPTPSADTLDFFIDDTLKPTFSVCYTDLFSGKVYPFVPPLCGNQLGGFYCYLPIPFSKSCRIVKRSAIEQFHQIQYRLYGDDEEVRSFNISPDTAVKAALDRISRLWAMEDPALSDFCSEKYLVRKSEATLLPGKSSTIFELNGGGRILGFTITPASSLEGLTKDTDLRITWDGESSPAVFCPAADFFGFAFGSISMQSLLLGTRNNKAYCLLPMPFDRSARIELISRAGQGAAPVKLETEVYYSELARDPGSEGKFYAQWIRDTVCSTGIHHTIADISGKGHFIGTILQARGLKAGMTIFFEGDDSTSIDGVCRLHGTGSEDYFNGGWYAMMDRWDDKMSLPLHGSLGYSLPFCRTGGYRLYLSDKLSFSKSLWQGIEHGPEGNSFPSDYTSLGLYYCDTAPERQVTPDNRLSRVYIPDTLYIYPQLTDYTIYGNMGIETTWKYGTGGESYTFTPGPDSWLRMSFRDLPEGSYSLYIDIIKGPGGCDFSLWQRQKQVSGWISSYSNKEEREENKYICDLRLPPASRTLTLRFRTGGEKKSLLLNRIILIRQH